MYDTLYSILTFYKTRLESCLKDRRQAYLKGFDSASAQEYRMLKYNAAETCIHEYQEYLDDTAIVCLHWVEMNAKENGREDGDVVAMRKNFDKELTASKMFVREKETDLKVMIAEEEKMRKVSQGSLRK